MTPTDAGQDQAQIGVAELTSQLTEARSELAATKRAMQQEITDLMALWHDAQMVIAKQAYQLTWTQTEKNLADTEIKQLRDWVSKWRSLAEYGFYLVQYGEHAPGGDETWRKFEQRLRALTAESRDH